jgi:sigma-B regulation protein RsbU (phosphoserine phosphatase)
VTPLEDRQAEAGVDRAPGPNGSGPARAEQKPLLVLVVDDEPDIETLIRQRFKRRPGDFSFVFARNGQEALERLKENPALDLVVTDINMPVMDGLTLLGRLNAMDGRVMKAVILSAYGDMENIRTAMNRGAFDFLTKPIDFQDFESTLRRTRDALVEAQEGLEARSRLSAIEQELDIAASIQASMLPREFLPGRTDFGIYAAMAPARRVGGDFYDFFLIDEQRLGFVIGDVSGKGVPAALFMAVSRTLLRATALHGTDPAECLRYANEVLGGQREGGVFVTVFYGILHTDTGELEYGIAGHNPPYRVSEEITAIAEPSGVVIGLLPDMEYQTGRMQLARGDEVVLFTDGVPEAMNAEQRFFGEKRLRAVLAAHRRESPKEIVDAVLAEVGEFTAGAAQSDDITVMSVKWG